MKFTVYIIYSPTLDLFYVGQTYDLEKRIQEHNTAAFKNSFTSKTQDWNLFLSIGCRTRELATKIEQHIKSMRKRKYYFDLKEYPEIVERLLIRYKN
jgi:putative endonuclease